MCHIGCSHPLVSPVFLPKTRLLCSVLVMCRRSHRELGWYYTLLMHQQFDLPCCLPCTCMSMCWYRHVSFGDNFECQFDTFFFFLFPSTIFIASFCLFPASFLCVGFLSLLGSMNFSCLISSAAFTLYGNVPVSCPCPPSLSWSFYKEKCQKYS